MEEQEVSLMDGDYVGEFKIQLDALQMDLAEIRNDCECDSFEDSWRL